MRLIVARQSTTRADTTLGFFKKVLKGMSLISFYSVPIRSILFGMKLAAPTQMIRTRIAKNISVQKYSSHLTTIVAMTGPSMRPRP